MSKKKTGNLRKEAPEFSEQIDMVCDQQLREAVISSIYSLRQEYGHLQLHYSGPGALTQEYMTILPNSVPDLYRLFTALMWKYFPEKGVLQNDKAAENFLEELKNLEPAESQ